MALNFLGLGVNFASQDKGLKGSLTDITAGVSNLSQSIIDASVASAKMAFKPPNFGPAISMAGQLAQDVKVTTTAIEAHNVAADKMTSASMAGLNLTSAELKEAKREVARTALSMNTDIGSVNQSMIALKQSGVDVRKLGFSGFQEYQKFLEVTGTDATKFAATTAAMREQLGYTEEGIRDLLDQQAAIGKKFNRGREAINSFAGSVELVLQHAARFPDTFGKEQVNKFLRGTEVVAGALQKIGVPAEQATQTAQKLTETLFKGQQNLQDVFSGLSDDLGVEMQVLLEHFGGSSEAAFRMLEQSPEKFIETVGKTASAVSNMEGMTDAKMGRFRSQMEKTFGTGVLRAVNNYDKLVPVLKEAGKEIENQKGSAAGLAKAYKDGRTAADRFNLIQEFMVTRLKQVDGVMKDGQFLKAYRKQTKDLTDTLSKFAAKKGPIGTATKKLIEFRAFGIMGALGAGSEMGLMLSEMAKQFQPILAVMPGIVAAFGALVNPMTLVAGGIAAIYFGSKDLAKGKDSLLAPVIEKLAKKAPQILEKVREVFTTIFSVVKKVLLTVWDMVDWNAVGKALVASARSLKDGFVDLFESINWNRVANRLKDLIAATVVKSVSLALGLIDLTIEWVGAFFDYVNWSEVGNAIGRGLTYAIGIALKLAWVAITELPGLIWKAMKASFSIVMGIIDGITDALAEAFSPLTFLFDGIAVILKTAVYAALVLVGAAAAALAVFFAVSTGIAIVGWAASAAAALTAVNVAFVAVLGVGAAAAAGVAGIILAVGAAYAVYDRLRTEEEIANSKTMSNYGKINRQIAMGEMRMLDERAKRVNAYKKAVSGLSLAKFSNEATKAADSLKAMNAEAARVAKGQDETGMSLQEARAQMNKSAKANEEFTDKFGVSLYQYDRITEKTKILTGVDEKLLAQLKAKNTFAVRAIEEEQARIASSIQLRLIDAAKAKKAGDIDQAEYDKRIAKINEFAEASRNSLEMSAKISAGLVEVTSLTNEQLMASAAAVTDSYLADFKKKSEFFTADLAGLSEKVQGQVKDAQSQLVKAMQAEVSAVMTNAETTAVEKLELTKKIYAKYEEQGKQLIENVNKTSNAVGDIAMKNAESSLGNAIGALQQGWAAAAAQTQDAGGEANEILKEVGLTGKDAADMVGSIGAINPKRFRRNMNVVRNSFFGFLEELAVKAEKLSEATAESLNKFWETSEKGWHKQTDLLRRWSMDAGIHIQKYWNEALIEAAKSAYRFEKLMGRMMTYLSSLSERFNILDLLASPTEIQRWANAVVAALANAFRSGVHADAMISSAYRRALSSANTIRANAGSAVPETQGAGDIAAGDQEARSAAGELVRALDTPNWTTGGAIYDFLQEQTELLRTIANGSGAGEATGRKPRARKDTGQRRDAV